MKFIEKDEVINAITKAIEISKSSPNSKSDYYVGVIYGYESFLKFIEEMDYYDKIYIEKLK